MQAIKFYKLLELKILISDFFVQSLAPAWH